MVKKVIVNLNIQECILGRTKITKKQERLKMKFGSWKSWGCCCFYLMAKVNLSGSKSTKECNNPSREMK